MGIDEKHWDDCVPLDSFDRRLIIEGLLARRDFYNAAYIDVLVEHLKKYPHRDGTPTLEEVTAEREAGSGPHCPCGILVQHYHGVDLTD